MSKNEKYKQTYGMSEDEYDRPYPPEKRPIKHSKKEEDLSRLVVLLSKLEHTHSLDDLEKSEVRGIVKRTGSKLKDAHMDYLGIKKHHRKRTTLVVAALAIVALITYGSYLNAKESEADLKAVDALATEAARLANDPISSDGVYTAVNSLRVKSGAQALATIPNLTTAAQQGCEDMSTSGYFDYTNPATGKTMNNRITDNQGGYYFKTYVSSIGSGITTTQTATEVATKMFTSQATNLNNPTYNSVGWAVCTPKNKVPLQSEEATIYVVGMLAEKADKPVTPQYVAPTPKYSLPKTEYTNCYTDLLGQLKCTTTSY